jgi:hypothetical protein
LSIFLPPTKISSESPHQKTGFDKEQFSLNTENVSLHHIGYGIHWWQENFIQGKKSEWNPPTPPKTREAVVAYLSNSFAILKKTVTSTKLDEASVHGVYATLDHITHHRSQAIAYLRNNNITPPEYIY